MNFYKQAALALDHLDTKQGSVKGSVAAAGVAQGNESKRVLARESEWSSARWTEGLVCTPWLSSCACFEYSCHRDFEV